MPAPTPPRSEATPAAMMVVTARATRSSCSRASAAERHRYPLVPALPQPSRGRHEHATAAKNVENTFISQVHEQIDFGPAQTKWQPGEARVSKIVFIGRNLDRKFLTEKINECVVPGATE